MKIRIYIILFSVLILGCEKTVTNFEVPDKPPKLVIQGRLIADSLCRINVSKSLSFNDELQYIPVEDAALRLFKGQSEIGNFAYQSDGWYLNSDTGFSEPDNYRLDVGADGYKGTTTHLYIPDKPKFVIERPEIYIGIYPDCLYCPPIFNLVVDIIVDDDREKENYYKLEILRNYIDDYNYSDYYNPSYGYILVAESNLGMVSSNLAIEVTGHNSRYEIRSQGGDARGDAFIFSDRYFNGEHYAITVFVDINPVFNSDTTSGKNYKVWFRLSETDENYYEYAKNMARINQTEGNPLVEPVTVYSPVENGFGLVYGMNFKQDTLDLTDLEYSLDTIYLDGFNPYK